MKSKLKKPTQLQKLREKNKALQLLVDFYESKEPKDTTNPDPIDSIMSTLNSHSTFAQHSILKEVGERVANQRIKNSEMADAQAQIAKSYLDDFMQKHPSFITYKPSI